MSAIAPRRTAAPAIVLLSGGLDSATVAALVRAAGYRLHALSFRYGQRHGAEIAAAQRIATTLGAVEHQVIDVDLRVFGGSALTSDIAVPKDRDPGSAEIPITYVPARNTLFLSYALAFAEVRNSTDIFIGVNAVDYSGYPDCRPAFVEAFERLANVATRAGVEGAALRIHAPLLNLTKGEIIRSGLALGLDYGLTRSCYDPDVADRACGHCDSCQLRLRAFTALGMEDPAPYQPGVRVE